MSNLLDPNQVLHFVDVDLGSNFAKVISRINIVGYTKGCSNKEGHIF